MWMLILKKLLSSMLTIFKSKTKNRMLIYKNAEVKDFVQMTYAKIKFSLIFLLNIKDGIHIIFENHKEY